MWKDDLQPVLDKLLSADRVHGFPYISRQRYWNDELFYGAARSLTFKLQRLQQKAFQGSVNSCFFTVNAPREYEDRGYCGMKNTPFR